MRIEVSGQTFSFPNRCVCCGGPSDTALNASASKSKGSRVVRTTTKGWNFPYCSSCIKHVSTWRSASTFAVMAFILLAVAGCIIFSFEFVAVVAAGSAVVAFGIMALVRSHATGQCSSTCTCAAPAVAYLGWYGSQHAFEIASSVYAADFVAQNSRKLINTSSEVQRLVVAARQAEMVAPPPLLAEHKTDNDEEIVKCLAKLEAAKGPASRRGILRLALQKLTSEEDRQRLLLEACRIEVNAVLDKVDGLKTVSAKRRNLITAIEELQQDEIADELQATQLRLLQEAVQELDGVTDGKRSSG